MSGGLDLRDPSAHGHAWDLSPEIRPRPAAVACELHISVIRTYPDDPFFEG